ncbi:hypothetical protein L6164_001631 [Bauhinia variegata]|uniref:Uncharacterized protein n=1 Tax=Bauhinia variegata TaxID=167791 RepID=A0ACB9QA52_BAUVA|nr:hypothetical protein L6164_001631 [Bauhinia variegata]
MASPLLLFLTILSCFSLSSSLPHETILDAADILTDSGFVSMALTLEVISKTLLSHSPSLTIFAPSDSAFRRSGQPSIDLLQFHFAPLSLPLQNLRLLPAGTKIPTMFSGRSLTVTTSPSDHAISLNNVRISETPIYDDGFFLIYGIERFFNPNFQYTGPYQRPSPNSQCIAKNSTMSSSNPFHQTRETLQSGGYSVMASFLDMQLPGNTDQTPMTVFAPQDEIVMNHLGNFSEYPPFFLRHAVPCKLLWNDLAHFDDGSELPTYLEGFTISITRSAGVLTLNGVTVIIPDLFYSDKIVVHGVSDVLAAHVKNQEEVVETFDHTEDGHAEENLFDPGEF